MLSHADHMIYVIMLFSHKDPTGLYVFSCIHAPYIYTRITKMMLNYMYFVSGLKTWIWIPQISFTPIISRNPVYNLINANKKLCPFQMQSYSIHLGPAEESTVNGLFSETMHTQLNITCMIIHYKGLVM